MFYQLTVVLIAYFHISRADNIQDGKPFVTTPYGKILGTYAKSYSGRTYSEYLGVPYAQPPVGNLRFKGPQPLKKWYGTWIANFTIECAQWTHSTNGGHFSGQEDCLYSNIFVPKKDNDDELLDVIIYIHGGGLNWGSNVHFRGGQIMDKDVVSVAINYRLGPLGFLSTEDDIVPGNNGMKDQVAALKWIKENIKYFGGNPESITLVGLSAGGSSVHLHYMSPLSKGLFRNGISVSGTALCPWPLQENALQQTRQLAKTLGCVQKSTADLINCMQQRPVTQICEHTKIFRPWLYNPFSVFGVVVEKNGINSFLTEHPYQLLVEGKLQDLPWITSLVAHEGLYPVIEFIADDKYLAKLEEDWEDLAPHILHYEHTVDPELKSSISKKIKKYYFDNKPISSETNKQLIQVASDRLFAVDAEKAARLQAKANKAPTYFYYFSYENEKLVTLADILHLNFTKSPGVCHGDDLVSLFNPCEKELTENDFKMREVMLKIWTSFARTGKPDVNGREWKPVSGKPNRPLDYLEILSPDQIGMKQTEDMGNRHFWDTLQLQENEHLFPVFRKDEL